ncbi:MAG: type III-A CRISPR-associated protein Csm2 [Chlorobi bacterium]|nr:type III-A CRISPR-associated protein Csm2 [Chlorobiota bacterium]
MAGITAEDVVKKWLNESLTPYDKAEALAKFVVNNLRYVKCPDEKNDKFSLGGLSLSKMRKFYEQVSKLRAFVQNYQGNNENLWKEFEAMIMKLDVIIAYEMGRNSGERAYYELRQLIREAYKKISNLKSLDYRKNVHVFIDFMESLIAYHRLADTEGERIINNYNEKLRKKQRVTCEEVKNAYQNQVFPFKIEES